LENQFNNMKEKKEEKLQVLLSKEDKKEVIKNKLKKDGRRQNTTKK